MLNKEELGRYKERLETELKETEKHLKSVARRNPDNPNDWEPVPSEANVQPGDQNEFADSIEAFEENTAITKRLEIKYNRVKEALEKIKDGRYGYCEEDGEKHPIEKERLEANPSAATCLKHREE